MATVADSGKRVAALEAELNELKARLGGTESRSRVDLFGKYKDDPDFAEAARIGREFREAENRESLAGLNGVDEPDKPTRVVIIPGFGPVGAFRDDPTYDEAMPLGREHRDRENRESLAALDREEEANRSADRVVHDFEPTD